MPPRKSFPKTLTFRAALAALGALGALGTLAAGAALAQAPSSPPAPAPTAGSLTFEPTAFQPALGEAVAAEAGTLVVPESRRGLSARTLRLKLVRFRSTSKTPGPPIVYLAGGPGGSGIAAAKGPRFPLFQALREFGDVIALDQRGTGASEPATDCPDLYFLPFDKPLDRTEAEAILAAGMKACFERLRQQGIDPAAYTTRDSADDLDDLRRALGAPKITLWGISYGTHLALATLKAHGAHVARAILAGVEPLDHTLKLPSDQEALLGAIAGLVRQDRRLAKAVPDLKAAIARVLARLRAQQEAVSLVHPKTGQPVTIVLGPLDLQAVLADMLQGPAAFAGLPDLVAALEKGEWSTLAQPALLYRASRLPSAMSVAMDCASGAGADHLARIAAEAKGALLGDAINFPFLGICQGLGVPDLGDAFRQPVRSEVPVLLISGTLDGRTPPRNAEKVQKGLAKAQHLVIEGAGHSDPLFLSSPRILEAMKDFLRGRKLATARIVLDPVRFPPKQE